MQSIIQQAIEIIASSQHITGNKDISVVSVQQILSSLLSSERAMIEKEISDAWDMAINYHIERQTTFIEEYPDKQTYINDKLK